MDNLENIPNIGKVLAKRLLLVGISNGEELKNQGAENTFVRIKTMEPTACINELYAIEGAIKNIRWHKLNALRKRELKDFYKRFDK